VSDTHLDGDVDVWLGGLDGCEYERCEGEKGEAHDRQLMG
jgi:hypothetical protein